MALGSGMDEEETAAVPENCKLLQWHSPGREGVASSEGACSPEEQTGSEKCAHLPRVRMPEARGRHHPVKTAFTVLAHMAPAKLRL